MNFRTLHRLASFVPLAALSILLTACSSKADQAQDALAAYQAAEAAGDLAGARAALGRLVAVEEDNPEYWIQLGQLHGQAGAFNEAFYALTRAHELDRGNVAVLQALTQLALRGGALDQAEEFAEQLELLSPTDPAVKLTYAYVALRRGDAAKAESYADQLLALSPYEANARILKARSLLRQDKGDEAIALLTEQVRLQPGDIGSRQALIGLLERRDDWAGVVTHGLALLEQQPDDRILSQLVVEAALRANKLDVARRVTLQIMEKDRTNLVVSSTLDRWAQLRPRTPFNEEVRRLAAAADPARKVVLAAYLLRTGDARTAAELVQPYAVLPVSGENEDANAVYGAALAALGQGDTARDRLNQVVSLDAGHYLALRGRIELALQQGQASRAIKDAQRLVSVAPANAEAWIVASRVYAAAGDREQAGRTLWNAFHQISANRMLYEELRRFVATTQGPDAVRRLDQEFGDQRDAAMTREFM